MIVPQKFPTKTELTHVSALRKYQRLYELEHKAVLGLHDKIRNEYKSDRDIVYISHAIPARIADFYGDFVQGDETRLTIEPPKDDLRKLYDDVIFDNDLIEKIYDIGVEQSEFGYSILHVFKDEKDKTRIELTPQDTFYPQKDGSVVTATYRKIENINEYLVLTQQYMVVNNNVEIERKAWRANNNGVITGEAQLSDMAKILDRELEEKSTIENLDVIPFIVINNGRKQKSGYGKSDFFDILPNLAEVNERATHVSTQLLKNLSAKMVVPNSNGLFDDDGKPKDWDMLAVEGKDNIIPKFITIDNPLIADTMEFIMYQLRIISWTSSVPMFNLIKGNQPERVESMRIQLYDAIRKTNTKRAKVKRGLKDALRICAKLNGLNSEEDAVIEMSDVLPIDEYVEAQTEALKVSSGLSSRRSSIMRISNMSEADAEEEIKQIEIEDKVAGVGNPDNAPKV